MDKIKALILVAGLALGIMIGLYMYPVSISDINSSLEPFVKFLQETMGKVALWWASIPDIFRGLLLAGIPTVFTLFLAWTKNRAMQKVQQTQQQAQQQIGMMTEKLSTVQNRNLQLEQQVSNASHSADLYSQMENRVTNAEAIAEQKTREFQELQNSMNTMERTYQGLIQDIKQKELVRTK
jgi:hypothetical protein